MYRFISFEHDIRNGTEYYGTTMGYSQSTSESNFNYRTTALVEFLYWHVRDDPDIEGSDYADIRILYPRQW